MSELKDLRVLKLARNPGIGDDGLSNLKNLSRLHELWLDGTGVTDAGLDHLVRLRNLGTVYATGTKMTAAGERTFKGRRFKYKLPPCQIWQGELDRKRLGLND